MPVNFVCRDPENVNLPCPICDGKGVYALDVPVQDSRFGKLQRCPNYPVEKDRDMHERLRRYGNLQAYREKTFHGFRTNGLGGSYTPNIISSLEKAKDEAQKYAVASQGWIVFEGPYGCGKTHLAVAIGNTRLEQHGEQVVFVTAPDLLDFLRMSFVAAGETPSEPNFERIRKAPFLILDELGVENPSSWAKEKLFQLLNYRHVHLLPTVITTNMPLDELDPWLGSRIMDHTVVNHIKINAPDFRRSARLQSQDSRFNNLQLYAHMRFDTFNTESSRAKERESLIHVKRAAEEWAGEPREWLCILGDFGSGKTHLAASIANHLQDRGRDLIFTTVPDLLDHLRMAFDPESNTRFDKRFHDIVNIPILILDDLSVASATPWAKEKLFQIIEYRYLSKAPTVVTASDTIESMEEKVPRFATRLLDTRICDVYALDRVRSYVDRLEKRS